MPSKTTAVRELVGLVRAGLEPTVSELTVVDFLAVNRGSNPFRGATVCLPLKWRETGIALTACFKLR